MKKYIIFLLLSVISLQIQAQEIKVDIFGNLQYVSRDHRYQAFLKKDIFDNLIFSDNQNNKLRFKKDYIELNYNRTVDDEEVKRNLFRQHIDRYFYENGYKATYDIDIFGTIIMEDNLNQRIETGTDIFGKPTYEENRNGVKITIRRDLSGNLEYRAGAEKAQLKKDIFHNWGYTDSSGNKFEFSQLAWEGLFDLYGSEEEILLSLVENFLYP
jgi:hypothetical protein